MKNPLIVIAALFLASYFIVDQLANQGLSDEPVVLHKNNPPEIIMFGTPGCTFCIQARQFFDKHQLPYIEHDIESSDKHRQLFYMMGGKGTPLIIVNKQIIHGFEEDLIRQEL
ncbi:MAG: glutaredoxin family protein [Gammaproteobacteria bacterium]|nr:glutaredoxin family protein [Gammaproteobacteria bacterium]